jgi:hypothetical protein
MNTENLNQNTKQKVGGLARPTASLDRDELVAVLEECGVSVAGFDGLRCDSYEKHLAKRSLAELESAYLTLLKPGEASAELQKKFPRWSKGHKYSEQLPSINTLMSIKHRIVAEETANGVSLIDCNIWGARPPSGVVSRALAGNINRVQPFPSCP